MATPQKQRQLFETSEMPTASAKSDEVVEQAPPFDANTPLTGRTVFAIDSHSLIYQVFHALPEMTGPRGQPVAAVHGYLRDLCDIVEKQKPDYLACTFDLSEITFRNELFTEYKAHREEMPGDLQSQVGEIRRFLAALGLPVLECAGFEADDIMAGIAKMATEQLGKCVLVTSDKDCRQLINDRVCVYLIRKNLFYGAPELMADWGIRPDQVVDFQAMVGDPVDNVPGIPLIGPKAAKELLEKYGSLESILDHAHEVSGQKKKENLLNGRDRAMLSRELVKLRDDAPLEIDWPRLRPGLGDAAAVNALCQELGFRQLGHRLVRVFCGGDAAAAAPESSAGELKDVAGDSEVPAPIAATSDAMPAFEEAPWNVRYETIATEEALLALVAEMEKQPRLSIDTETTSQYPRRAEIVGYALSWVPDVAYYVPVKAPPGEPQIEPAKAAAILKPVLERADIAKVGQNLKYDIIVLRGAGIDVQGVSFDTLMADFLLEPGIRSHSLDELSARYLQHTTVKIDSLIGSGKNQKRMDEAPVEKVSWYAAEDADVALKLTDKLGPRIEESGFSKLFYEIEMPLVDVLAEIEFNGFKIDADLLRAMGEKFAKLLETFKAEIYAIAGREFNIDSRIQLSALLFEELGLPVLKKTKTGASTDAEVLEDLAKLHPLPKKIIEYRQVAKLKSTYVDALPEQVIPATGRIHTSLKQDVAATGRLSSTDPNLQNIPIRSELGRDIRSAFLPGHEGWKLLSADYSQIELRVLAHFCQDAALMAAFRDKEDIHTRVAAQVHKVSASEVDREMRRRAKAINFGIIYGQSAFGLSKALDISQQEATTFIEAYFAQYPSVGKFMDTVLDECRKKGYVETILGRRRPVEGVRPQAVRVNSKQKTLPERIAINSVIQGSAADMIKKAMIGIHRRLKSENFAAKMLLQVHDELVFEFPPEEQSRLVALVKEEMGRFEGFTIPLQIDVKVGPNWASCEAFD
jgi:DNA polymerase-1